MIVSYVLKRSTAWATLLVFMVAQTTGAAPQGKDLDTELIKGARFGDIARVQALLVQGADINAKNEAGWTALMKAAYEVHPDMVAFLLAKGADVNARNEMGMTPLMLALISTDFLELRQIMEKQPSAKDRRQILQCLLAQGANVHLKDRGGNTALMWAAGTGPPAIVKAILAKGAQVNTRSNSYHPRLLTRLFALEGIAIHLIAPSKGTALMRAAARGHAAIVKALLAKGARVNYHNSLGKTALQLATENGHREIVHLLKRAGARE